MKAFANYFSNNKGISLIDVLAYLAIVGLTIIISIPYFRQFQENLELTSSTNNLIADLRLAQQLTISQQTTHGVSFDSLLDQYSILKILSGSTTIKTVDLPTGVSFSSVNITNDFAEFTPYGSIVNSGSVSLENSLLTEKIIEIKPSGYVRLQ